MLKKNQKKCRMYFVGLLAALLVLGTLSGSVLALSDEWGGTINWAQHFQDEGLSLEDDSAAGTADYVEGEAIACVRTSPLTAAAQSDTSLLAGATTLMTIDEGGSTGDLDTYGVSEGESLVLVQSETLSTQDLIAQLEALPEVSFAEPNTIYTLSATGDHSDKQWAYNGANGINVEQWNTYDAGGSATPKVDTSNVVVAVLDTGVDYGHEDLENVMWNKGKDYESLTALGGGTYGYNAMSTKATGEAYDSSDPMDDHSHGTHCAGIIGAQWNNFGVSGATTGTQIMAIKAANEQGAFPTSAVIKGFSYIQTALQSGVEVKAINNSWGGAATGQSVDMAITEVGKLGAISVFASGNESVNADIQSRTCSTLKDNPYVVVVNATDRDGNAASFTNYGDRTTDVAAPGVAIFSTVPTELGAPDSRYVTAKLTDDYSRDTVNGTFNYTSSTEGGEIVDLAIETGQGEDGSSNALSITNAANDGELTITGGEGTTVPESKYLALRYKRTTENPDIRITAIRYRFKLKNGEWSEPKFTFDTSSSWQSMKISIPADIDYENFEMQLQVAGLNAQLTNLEGMSILVDNIILTDELFPYSYMSGTSMATPAVTGEAAILAAAFPEDAAEKRAARIIGSVTPLNNTAGQSISGGLVQVDKALAENTVPVLNTAAVTDTNTLTIKGYFFGGTAGKVTIDGQDVDVKSWEDEEITLTLPVGMAGGEKRIEVTSSEGSGHQYYEIGETTNLYERISLPSAEENPDFYALTGTSLYGLKGKLYYLGTGRDTYLQIWEYTPGKTENNGWSKKTLDTQLYDIGKGACTWKEQLVVAIRTTDQKDGIGIYNPETNTWQTVCAESVKGIFGGTVVNNGSGLYLIGGQIVTIAGAEVQTGIYSIDPTAETITQVGDLKTGRNNPVASYTDQGDVYVAAGTDASGNLVDGLERLSFTDSGVNAEIVKEKVLPEGLLEKQEFTTVGGTIAGGMLITGPVQTDESGRITADTYSLSYEGAEGFVKTGSLVSTSKLFNPTATAYHNAYYVLAETNNTTDYKRVFSVDTSVKTLAQPGDAAVEPVTPVTPVNPATPQGTNGTTNILTGIQGSGLGILLGIIGVLILIGGGTFYLKKLHKKE